MKWLAIFLLTFLTLPSLAESKDISLKKVIAVHQVSDEAMASFDFFGDEMSHQCGGKPSNRFRSYSKYTEVAARKFTLVMAAFEKGYPLNMQALGCEGSALKVGRIGIRH